MRFYAYHDYQVPYFTIGGTMTVLLAGAAAGAATGVWLWLGNRLFPTRPRMRHAFFWLGLALLTVRVLQPLSTPRLAYFAPLSAAHGIMLMLAVSRPSPPNS